MKPPKALSPKLVELKFRARVIPLLGDRTSPDEALGRVKRPLGLERAARSAIQLLNGTPQAKGAPPVIPFRMGDVVDIKKGRRVTRHIIKGVMFYNPSFQYSTNRSAWHPHSSCTLVSECDAASLKELKRAIEEEEEADGR